MAASDSLCPIHLLSVTGRKSKGLNLIKNTPLQVNDGYGNELSTTLSLAFFSILNLLTDSLVCGRNIISEVPEKGNYY